MKYGWSIGYLTFEGDCETRETALAEAIGHNGLGPGATVWTLSLIHI